MSLFLAIALCKSTSLSLTSFILETFDHEHIAKLKAEMNAAGFEIQDL